MKCCDDTEYLGYVRQLGGNFNVFLLLQCFARMELTTTSTYITTTSNLVLQ